MAALDPSLRPSIVLLAAVTAAATLGAACGGGQQSSGGSSTSTSVGSGGPGTGGGFGGFGNTGGGQGQVQSVSFDPPAITLQVDGKTPQAASFTLKATYAGGAVDVVTPESMQFDRP